MCGFPLEHSWPTRGYTVKGNRVFTSKLLSFPNDIPALKSFLQLLVVPLILPSLIVPTTSLYYNILSWWDLNTAFNINYLWRPCLITQSRFKCGFQKREFSYQTFLNYKTKKKEKWEKQDPQRNRKQTRKWLKDVIEGGRNSWLQSLLMRLDTIIKNGVS